MELIPESIQGTNTLGLDRTFLMRLSSIAVERLAIDMEHENDMLKLTLYLQQFGIPVELLPDLGTIQFRDLLQRVLLIYRLSGTPRSIELLAEAVGATSAKVVRNTFVLDHSVQALYNSMHLYDTGRQHRSFCVDVKIKGVSETELPTYTATFRSLFRVFEPVSVHLRDVLIDGE